MLLERGVVEETDDSVGNRSAAEAAGEKERDGGEDKYRVDEREGKSGARERARGAGEVQRSHYCECNDHTIVRAHLNTSGEGAARPPAGLSRMLVADTQNS